MANGDGTVIPASGGGPPGKKGKGLLGKLGPKGKRYALVVAAGALLALIYLMRKRSAEAGAVGTSPSDLAAAAQQAAAQQQQIDAQQSAQQAYGSPAGGTGFSDPSTYLSELGTGIAQSQANLQQDIDAQFGTLGSAIAGLGTGIAALDHPPAAPGHHPAHHHPHHPAGNHPAHHPAAPHHPNQPAHAPAHHPAQHHPQHHPAHHH
jgi:hypothetical protein